MPIFGQKLQKVTILEVFTLVSQSLSHILGNNTAYLSKGLKMKIIFNEFQKLVKNSKKDYFYTIHFTPNLFLPKKEVLKSHSLLTH